MSADAAWDAISAVWVCVICPSPTTIAAGTDNGPGSGKEVVVTSKAQAAWEALNVRQQAYMTVLYDHDQAVEAERKQDAAAGYYDDTPASVWRWVNVVTPGRKLTSVQRALAVHDVRDDGTGSTLQALQRYGLIEVREEAQETARGRSKTVSAKLTRAGRAAVRAGTKEPPRRRRGELGEYPWKLLIRLWRADGAPMDIWSSALSEALISRPNPPLAEGRLGAYRITEAGREHYRTHWARYAQLYPDVAAPDPAGGADPWPDEVQKALDRLRRAVTAASGNRWSAHRRREEAERDAAKAARGEGGADAEWHALLLEQAQARATLAERHLERATEEKAVAIRRYAHAVLAAFTASVENHPSGTDLTAAVTAAADAGLDGSMAVAQPPTCGLHRVDTAVQGAYGTLTGTRKRRRPLPQQMRPARRGVPGGWTDPPPLDTALLRLEDLARTMTAYVDGGALRRELHPPAVGSDPADASGAPDEGAGGAPLAQAAPVESGMAVRDRPTP
ncbi:hypothetical protein [Streptomyces sp. NPDC001404]|uniref:hypothetical protein n=1 Tax=Streptomyces sp. NPDC001404 TaxID=3364571 RepID=UPI0036802942